MSRGRLLLVDDEADIRAIATIALERIGGWEVVAAASGGEALERAADGPWAAVLLDVMMPDLDGPSTLEALRAGPLGPEVPVVFLTAKVQATDRAWLEGLGAQGVIAKPFDPMTLGDDVGRLVGR